MTNDYTNLTDEQIAILVALEYTQLPVEDIAGPFTAVSCFDGETFEPVEFYLER